MSYIVSKLLYGLQVLWLNKNERKSSMDFHDRCIMQILHKPPSFISRIPNHEIMAEIGSIKLSYILLQHQLNFFAHISRLPNDNVCRQILFENDGINLREYPSSRRYGRPRADCGREVSEHAHIISPADEELIALMKDRIKWKSKVQQDCKDIAQNEAIQGRDQVKEITGITDAEK